MGGLEGEVMVFVIAQLGEVGHARVLEHRRRSAHEGDRVLRRSWQVQLAHLLCDEALHYIMRAGRRRRYDRNNHSLTELSTGATHPMDPAAKPTVLSIAFAVPDTPKRHDRVETHRIVFPVISSSVDGVPQVEAVGVLLRHCVQLRSSKYRNSNDANSMSWNGTPWAR